SAPGTKICGLCHQDCSARPRTKDAAGQYYCKDCYDKARQERATQAATPARPVRAAVTKERILPAAPRYKETPPAEDFGLIDDLAMLESSAAVVETPAAETCGGCGAVVAPGTVICTACGFNRQTGKKLSSVVMADVPRAKKARGGGGS